MRFRLFLCEISASVIGSMFVSTTKLLTTGAHCSCTQDHSNKLVINQSVSFSVSSFFKSWFIQLTSHRKRYGIIEISSQVQCADADFSRLTTFADL